MEHPEFLLVAAKELPKVFLKVVEAKKMLAKGRAKNASEAARMAGISRSAYYKYKDSVFLYDIERSQRTINLSLKLEDEPGILSTVLSNMYKIGVNILTVNQNIPVDGAAAVYITAKLDKPPTSDGEIVNKLRQMRGVIEAREITPR